MVPRNYNDLYEKITQMAIDIAVIKNATAGDKSTLSELKKK